MEHVQIFASNVKIEDLKLYCNQFHVRHIRMHKYNVYYRVCPVIFVDGGDEFSSNLSELKLFHQRETEPTTLSLRNVTRVGMYKEKYCFMSGRGPLDSEISSCFSRKCITIVLCPEE